MKKFKIIYLFILSLILIGCSSNINVEIFRFVSRENTISVGQEITLQLVMGNYPEDSKVIYKVSEEGIIDLEDGEAFGLATGEVIVTATVDNIVFATTKVIVEKEAIDALKILTYYKNNNEPLVGNVVYIDQELKFAIQVFPSHISNKVTWAIESGSDIASISEGGIFKPLRGEKNTTEFNAGGAKVRVVATSVEDPKMKVKKDLYIKYRPTTLITLSVPNGKTDFSFSELEEIKSIQVTAVASPNTANPTFFTYTSSDKTILIINEQGLISFPEKLKEGTVTITVKSIDNKTATIIFTLTNDAEPEPEE